MNSFRRACLYNTEPASSKALREQIGAASTLEVTHEVGTPEQLAELLRKRESKLVFFHLDPDPGPVLEVIDQVSVRYPDLVLIATSHQTSPQVILSAMRAGCDQFVCEPIEPGDLGTALARVAGKCRLTRKAGRCVCVAGAAGGCGTTSIACGLALEIARQSGTRCILADLDLQFGTVAVTFDCEPQFSIFDLAQEHADGELDRAVLEAALTTFPCNVSILPRPATLRQQRCVTPELVRRVMDLLTGSYAHVVVDLPRQIDACTRAVLDQADLMLIVCQLSVLSIGNAKRYMDALAELGIPPERVEVVVNRHDGSRGLITIEDAQETIEKPVFAWVPNDYAFVSELLDLGRPADAFSADNPVRTAIGAIAQKIVGATPAHAE